jgi:hypothetical protein
LIFLQMSRSSWLHDPYAATITGASNMNDPITSVLQRLFVACLLGLSVLAPARAQAQPPVIQPVWYATSVDLSAGMAHFSIRFDRAPDLATGDEFFRPADTFQFWTDTASDDPIGSTYAGIEGYGPLGTQTVLTGANIPSTGSLTYIWPQLLSYLGPRDPGGWGSIEANGAYTLGPDNSVSFDVPLSLLHAADGVFYYVFETFQYGAGGTIDYAGISGQEYFVSCVPEPSEILLLGSGLAVLAFRARRRRAGQA